MITPCLIKFYQGGVEKYALPCGVVTDNATTIWICTNDLELSGDTHDERALMNYRYSWSVTFPEFMFDRLMSSRYFNFMSVYLSRHDIQNCDTWIFIKLPVDNIKGGVILSDRLYGMLQDMEVFCKKGSDKGVVKIKLPFHPEIKGDSVVYYRLPLDVNDKSPNSFDVRRGEVSYFIGEQLFNENMKWDKKPRQIMKAAKFANMLQPFYEGDESLFGRMNELVAEKLKGFEVIDILITDEVEKIYKMPVHEHSGTLASSCMRNDSGHDCRHYSDFYDSIGAKIAYTLAADGRLLGRALLWHGVINKDTNEEFCYMDRIYGSESMIMAFKEWAEENGFYSKIEQSYNNSKLQLGSNFVSNYHFNAGCCIDEFDGVPFVDTMCYYSGRYITSYGSVNRENSYCMQNCDGSVPCSGEECCCHECGANLDECERYEIDGNLYCDECCVYSEYNDCYIINEEATMVGDDYYYNSEISSCGHCGCDIAPSENTIETASGDTICESCYERHYDICEVCNEVVSNNDIVEVDGRRLCNSCYAAEYVKCDECDSDIEKGSEHVHNEATLCDECYEKITENV